MKWIFKLNEICSIRLLVIKCKAAIAICPIGGVGVQHHKIQINSLAIFHLFAFNLLASLSAAKSKQISTLFFFAWIVRARSVSSTMYQSCPAFTMCAIEMLALSNLSSASWIEHVLKRNCFRSISVLGGLFSASYMTKTVHLAQIIQSIFHSSCCYYPTVFSRK